jgi:hypothetical protein
MALFAAHHLIRPGFGKPGLRQFTKDTTESDRRAIAAFLASSTIMLAATTALV